MVGSPPVATTAAVGPWWRIATIVLALVLLHGCSPAGSGGAKSASLSTNSRLETGDTTLAGGEYYDAYPLTAELGDRIVVDLVSHDFDPYLVVVSPTGQWIENDDYEGSTERSRLEIPVAESGTWEVYATSYEAGVEGTYELSIDTAPHPLPGYRYERGSLAQGDDTLTSGELVDPLSVTGEAGRYLWVDLRSSQFDPYLIVRSPSGEQWENDDYEGSLGRSVLGIPLPESGEYTVLVTSALPGASGAWDLSLRNDLHFEMGQRVEEGELAAGDAALRSGELVDEYHVEGVAGQQLRLRLTSPDFDTYLILVDPQGRRTENDDDPEGGSSIRQRLTVPGTHQVLVTSYSAEERGRYALEIELGDVRPAGLLPAIELGSGQAGRLEPGDEELTTTFVDRYALRADAGTPVEILVSSDEFDTYLVLRMPDGTVLENDDDWDDASRSHLALTLPQSGTYEVAVTSYGPYAEGDYRLDLHRPSAGPIPPVRGAPNRTFALLAGISDYGGRLSDLENTAQDARNLRDSLLQRAGVRPEDTVLLLDDGATADAVRGAILDLAGRMSPADELLIFYSGHGGRLPREHFQSADPDAVDETLSLYDAELSDDELAALLDRVPGRVLLVLDSCFAGGFAKDVIARPGRMGLFSSEEDVTSSVADKFRAGGFLAAFMIDALEDERADDGDGYLTTLELSHYLHERYRTDVKGGGPEDYIRTGGPQLGYQRLVVDRGSLGPADVLFRIQPGADTF